QNGWTSVRSNHAVHSCMRLVNSVANGRIRMDGLCRIADRFTDSARITKLGFPFSHGSSGPWGEDVPGGWMTFEKARAVYLRTRRWFFTREQPLYSFWYDWHATY